MSTEKKLRIYSLVRSIQSFLEANQSRSEGVEMALEKMQDIDLSLDAVVDREPKGTRHTSVLSRAIDDITSPDLRNIADCLKQARQDLVWLEDEGRYYQSHADLGDGFRNCNLHTVLIGPNGCGFDAEDFCLGLFMFGPRTLYRDHAHDAPELYVNLSPRSGWRLSSPSWQDYEAGSIIWNAPGDIHATRTYGRPFLSVFAWLENIGSGCRVVPFPDWPEIEEELRLSGL
ncbi:MAG: dimethylsulfonioproprionate lyase family protein [Paracoccaceae bacterium]|nr:dimethylsulfonioproprionate lyase family protein [Paracoccaceae bacterium]